MCSKKPDKSPSVKNSPSTITLSNQCSRNRTVYLQTLCVIARGQGREKRVRILLDSASQYSHVSERLIAHLGLIPHRYENVIHSLFGGTQTKPKQHGVYSIELSALNRDYSCCLEVLSEGKICNSVPKITDQRILNNLRELNIEFSDSFSEDLEIDVLVGSNVLGRILLKKCCELDSGLSVVETKLGNTIIGMQNEVCHIDRNVMTTLAMYVRSIKLTDLWDLENLGISNPTLVESKHNSYEEALNDFQQKLTILPNGRYELQLPWKHDPANLPDNKEVTVPRYIAINGTSEIHVFVDASKSSYGACVFVRTVVENDVKVSLLRSKTRVAPLKSLTIPRLELMACCIGARLANSIVRALHLPEIKVTYWTDSEVALWWIREQGNWSVFVANRVKEIRELTKFQSWRHVPGNMNIADLLSRGCTPKQMLDSKWWEGPQWLKKSRGQWPASEINCEPKDVILEKRKSELVNVNISEEVVPWYAVRFSKYNSIVRLMGWILRFINNSRVPVEERKLSKLSSDDIEKAERVLIRLVQGKMFPNLKSIPIVNVFKDNEGIIRVKTKITERKDDPNFIAPILMPSKCLLTTRLIEYYHLKNCHAGVQILTSILREKFWIMKTRKTVREVVMKCVPCRRYSSNSPMSDPVSLPADRVKDANAFDITGIDLAGPLFTRDGGKVWIVLYTCAIYRAIHLELVSSLSTECFMLSLRRFIARRTRPETIYTDNGTNFVGTNSELKNLDWDKIMRETDIKPIKWKFNPPTAAWWGGWSERLVRVIKELLKRTLGKAILKYEELLTVLCDCEAVVNSRPLTYISEDPNDLILLTPSLFLNGKSSYDTIDLDLSEFSKFQKRIRYRRKLIHDFRSRFRKEYLGQLRQKRPGKSGHDFKVGEVVMIEEPSKKRVYWPLGKVISLLPGRDGKVRTLKLKFKNSELIRPIQRVYPLEVPFINEIVKIDGVPTSSVKENELTNNAVIRNKITKSGRLVKIPERLGLFNEVLHAFE
ncbi:uncharacterized protein LOC129962291 [Argiope bruennichi]|uniref:uncharacterized protein LOC129962291 n=1 Tax=Argiope bruennichi TaxID=94029 RepID=UPI00249479C4|nr:uncharacterized protein LOC129962291 [Argiope bruennichi]